MSFGYDQGHYYRFLGNEYLGLWTGKSFVRSAFIANCTGHRFYSLLLSLPNLEAEWTVWHCFRPFRFRFEVGPFGYIAVRSGLYFELSFAFVQVTIGFEWTNGASVRSIDFGTHYANNTAPWAKGGKQ